MLLIRACRICERSVEAQLLSTTDTMKKTRHDRVQAERRDASALWKQNIQQLVRRSIVYLQRLVMASDEFKFQTTHDHEN